MKINQVYNSLKHNEYFAPKIKLTLLFFGIISFIIIFFSALVIKLQDEQVDHFGVTIMHQSQNNPFLYPGIGSDDVQSLTDSIKASNLHNIIIIDLSLLTISIILSYILAGQVIEPIVDSYKNQKRFIANASHEFKTPLTCIKSEVDDILASNEESAEAYKRVLRSVNEEVNRMTNLTNTLLSIAKSDFADEYRMEKIDLLPIIQVQIGRIKTLAIKKSLTIEFTPQEGVFTILGNKERLEQLFSIFLDNAVKYNQQGGKITINLVKDSTLINCTIVDTGIGIAKEHMDKLFNRFYRVSEDRNIKGFGLGLSIAKQIIDEHQASISLTSKEGKGTTIHLTFKKSS